MVFRASRGSENSAAIETVAPLPPNPILGEVTARVPMLRAMARLSSGCPKVGQKLVARTLRTALADRRSPLRVDRLTASLLAIQRRYQTIVPHRGCPSFAGPTAGTAVLWAKLDDAMRGLLPAEREVLFLGDGGGLRAPVLADSLGCSATAIHDLRCTARLEVINQLAAAVGTASMADVEDDCLYASLSSIALYRSLLADATDPEKRDALGRMIAEERRRAASCRDQGTSAAPDMAISRPNRWLRLMYVAYSHPVEG